MSWPLVRPSLDDLLRELLDVHLSVTGWMKYKHIDCDIFICQKIGIFKTIQFENCPLWSAVWPDDTEAPGNHLSTSAKPCGGGRNRLDSHIILDFAVLWTQVGLCLCDYIIWLYDLTSCASKRRCRGKKMRNVFARRRSMMYGFCDMHWALRIAWGMSGMRTKFEYLWTFGAWNAVVIVWNFEGPSIWRSKIGEIVSSSWISWGSW